MAQRAPFIDMSRGHWPKKNTPVLKIYDLNLFLFNVDQRAAGGRVLSFLWLRRERLDVSLLYLSWLPHAAGPALKAEFFCFLHPDPCFSLCLSSCVWSITLVTKFQDIKSSSASVSQSRSQPLTISSYHLCMSTLLLSDLVPLKSPGDLWHARIWRRLHYIRKWPSNNITRVAFLCFTSICNPLGYDRHLVSLKIFSSLVRRLSTLCCVFSPHLLLRILGFLLPEFCLLRSFSRSSPTWSFPCSHSNSLSSRPSLASYLTRF